MKKSSHLIPLLIIWLAIPFSCKKFIEQQKQNAIVDLVTNGTWRVAGYIQPDTINLKESFAGYSFKFNTDYTVYGNLNGEQTKGTWSVDIPSKSITSTFPGAAYPISLLNYTWKITDSYVDSVAAKTPVDSSYNILLLKKNS